jgi:uncharacterized membrane protein YsdA (DUF1294 family)
VTPAVTVVVVLIVLNAISFAMFGIDKHRARVGTRRISEGALLVSAVVSGTLGAWLAMRRFRHKTRKRSFIAAMICMSAIDAIVAIVALSLHR